MFGIGKHLVFFAFGASLMMTAGVILTQLPVPQLAEIAWEFRQGFLLYLKNVWWIVPTLFLVQLAWEIRKGIAESGLLPTAITSSIPVFWLFAQGPFYRELDREFRILNAVGELGLQSPLFWIQAAILSCLPLLLNGIALDLMRKMRRG